MKAYAAYARFPNGKEGVLVNSIRLSKSKVKAAVWHLNGEENKEPIEVLRLVEVEVSEIVPDPHPQLLEMGKS